MNEGSQIILVVQNRELARDPEGFHVQTIFCEECTAFVARDGTGVRLEEAKHFLVCDHFLALEHACPHLDDDAFHKQATVNEVMDVRLHTGGIQP
jgi:hypothetical protein